MYELREFRRAELTLERLFSAMQTHVGLQVGRRAEPFVTHTAFMRLLTRVNQMMLLKMCKLGEPLGARLANEGTFASVGSKVDFQVGQLSECL